MKISKEEIEQASQVAFDKKYHYVDEESSYKSGYSDGADWMYQHLEPLITDLSMERARRHNSQSSNINNISKRTKSEYGSHHWFATLMAINLHTGEFLMENTPDEETLRIWGKNLYENCIELIDHKYEIDLRLKESQPKDAEVDEKVKEAVKIALQTAAERATAHTESRFPSVHYCECCPVVDSDSILSLEQEVLEKLNAKS